jgi:hypothetical protein
VRNIFSAALKEKVSGVQFNPGAALCRNRSTKRIAKGGSPADDRGDRGDRAAGEPISVVALGGSITKGGETHMQRSEDSAIGQLFRWLETTFPNANHLMVNGGTSASESTFFSACLADHLPWEEVDLVLLEFDINDCKPHYRGGGPRTASLPWLGLGKGGLGFVQRVWPRVAWLLAG